MCQSATNSLVFLAIGVDDGSRYSANSPGEYRGLWHFGRFTAAPYPVSINVVPRLRIRKREVVWADSHDWAILFVQVMGVESLTARGMSDRPRQARCPLNQGPGEFPERMEQYIIHSGNGLPSGELYRQRWGVRSFLSIYTETPRGVAPDQAQLQNNPAHWIRTSSLYSQA